PGYRFARRGAGQSARVGTRVGHLQKIVVSAFIDAQDFLNLRLSLQGEVLRRTTAENKNRRTARLLFEAGLIPMNQSAFRSQNDRGCLVHIQRRIEGEFVSL